MPNRTFLDGQSAAEKQHQALRLAMASSLRHFMGDAPDHDNRDTYLRLADKDLAFASGKSAQYAATARRGIVGFVASTTFCAGNSLLFGFNNASMVSVATAGLGVGMLAYAEYSSRRLKNAISVYIQRLDNA